MDKENKSFIRNLILPLILGVFLVAGCGGQIIPDRVGNGGGEEGSLIEQVVLSGRSFELELALTEEEREAGLTGRGSIGEKEGMLFVFPDREPYPTRLTFWMKDCLTPIDLVFISREGNITAIHEMEPPAEGVPECELPRYSSYSPAQFAIELRGGMARQLGLRVGGRVDLRDDYLLSLAE